MPERSRVAIIGAGCLGIAALKNLIEEGFDATAFDRRECVGGIWHFTEDQNITSTSESTEWNGCSQMSCFTDFPFPDGAADFPKAPEVKEYIESYCRHFSLFPHIKLNCTVKEVLRTADDTKWTVKFTDQAGTLQSEIFDRLIMATGQTGKPLMPLGIGGLENYKGQIIHGISFKRGSDFKHKRVLVLGSGNSAADCAVELCGHADKIYLSHRNGGVVIPRIYNNVPTEYNATTRLLGIGGKLEAVYPKAWPKIFNHKCLEISKAAFGELPKEWRLNVPLKGQQLCNPIINDKIIPLLRKDELKIVHGIRSISADGTVELADGTLISDTDTIILCTGYTYDYSIIPESISPIRDINKQWQSARTSNGRPMHRLYRGLFSLQYPDSLAFIGIAGYPSSQLPLFDLVTMAIAQIWKGAYKLPSKEEMEAEVNERQAYLVSIAASNEGPAVLPSRLKVGPWMHWLHDAAGTGVNERLGYGITGWWYWLTHFSSVSKVMDSVNSPHIWRLFDGRRKKWDGAWEAIEKVNKDAKARKRK